MTISRYLVGNRADVNKIKNGWNGKKNTPLLNKEWRIQKLYKKKITGELQ